MAAGARAENEEAFWIGFVTVAGVCLTIAAIWGLSYLKTDRKEVKKNSEAVARQTRIAASYGEIRDLRFYHMFATATDKEQQPTRAPYTVTNFTEDRVTGKLDFSYTDANVGFVKITSTWSNAKYELSGKVPTSNNGVIQFKKTLNGFYLVDWSTPAGNGRWVLTRVPGSNKLEGYTLHERMLREGDAITEQTFIDRFITISWLVPKI